MVLLTAWPHRLYGSIAHGIDTQFSSTHLQYVPPTWQQSPEVSNAPAQQLWVLQALEVSQTQSVHQFTGAGLVQVLYWVHHQQDTEQLHHPVHHQSTILRELQAGAVHQFNQLQDQEKYVLYVVTELEPNILEQRLEVGAVLVSKYIAIQQTQSTFFFALQLTDVHQLIQLQFQLYS